MLTVKDLMIWYSLPETKEVISICEQMIEELKEQLVGEFEYPSQRDFIRGFIQGIRWVFTIQGEDADEETKE
jgi:hypothetical protein